MKRPLIPPQGETYARDNSQPHASGQLHAGWYDAFCHSDKFCLRSRFAVSRTVSFSQRTGRRVGDQLGFLTDGSRIVAGELLYRDFFEMLPPGTPLTYALFDQVVRP